MTRGIWIVLSAAIGFAIIMVQRDLLANEEYKVKENDTEGKVVLIPAGDFWMGCNPKVDSRCKRHEKPGRIVHLDAYRIDKTEVTLEQFEKCVQAGSCQEPKAARHCNWGKPGREKHPVNCVDWFQAKAYCEWMGKRLPTEAEWEKAARGQDGRMYPWGSESASCEYILTTGRGGWGCGKKSTWPVKPARSDRREASGYTRRLVALRAV
jgi:formylglycine-generating enzyme required for sulfatase activity